MLKRLAVALALVVAWAGQVAAPATQAAATTPQGPLTAPVVAPDAVNLAGTGLVPVTILSTADIDATAIDPESVALGAGTTAGRWDDGKAIAKATDIDGDGLDDLVVHFDKDELRATGDLAPGTTELDLTATLAGGGTVTGSAPVTTEVTLEVKFDEELRVRGSDRTLRSQRGRSLQAVRDALDRQGGGEFAPAVDPSTALRLDGIATEAAVRSSRPLPDMASWYTVTLPADADVDVVVAELEALPEISHAYPAPGPVPPPQATSTPDFTSMQGYFGPAPQGIDADFSRQDPRLRGAGIKVVDLEYDWNPFHEDLQLDNSSNVGGSTFLRYTGFGDEHGTAVFGEIMARDNGYGVTGGVPDVEMYGISPTRAPNNSWQPGPALAFLAALQDTDGTPWLKPGDAVILEQQTSSPLGGSRYAPLEWVPSVFDAIVTLTSMGVNVVSTGGNGNTNSDDPMYTRGGTRWFDPDVQHSGSILVGAGSSSTRERLSFSNYGTRFDLQAWGQNITTTGYCTLYCVPGNPNIRYSRSFSGTSGAGPIVTVAVVAIQSYIKATGQEPWSAQQIADLLKATGTPQGPNTSATQHIGPLPDLHAALLAIEVDAPATTAELSPAPTAGWYADPTVTLEADDGWGTGVDVTEYRLDGGAWTTYTGAFQVTGDGERTLEYRSTDGNGNVEDTNTLEFGVDTTGPQITLATPHDGAVYLLGDALDVDFTCEDALAGVATCDATLPAGTALPTGTVGFHDFTVTAGDTAGNTSQAGATYQVAWPFGGFLSPIAALPALNEANAGSSIPVRFDLGDDHGLGILADGSPASAQIDCTTGALTGGWSPTNSIIGLRFTDDGHYNYVWRTSSTWSGTCRQLAVTLVDGSTHRAAFAFD
jgi:hypothetical protein